MSDLSEDVPPLSPEALAFLAQHDATGEPTPAQLRRVRSRVLTSSTDVAPRARRSWLPPELWAVAAVVLLAVVGQLLYLALRTSEPATRETVEPQSPEHRMREAYRVYSRDEFEAALKTCVEPACTNLGRRISRAFDLAERIDTLDTVSLQALVAFDENIATTGRSVVADLIEARRRALDTKPQPEPEPETAPVSSEALFNDSRVEHRARNYERAVMLAERCVRKDPKAAPCWRQLGSSYASIAARDQSMSDMEKARRAYERFLAVAPADDEYVPRVRAILEQAGSSSPAPTVGSVQVRLSVGATTRVAMPETVRRFAVSEAHVAAVEIVGTSLNVLGNEPGRASVLVTFTSGAQTTYDISVR